jgi:predicted small secreted protein
MKKILRRALLAILAVSLAACSTISVVADTRSSSAAVADISAKRLVRGDDLRLRLISGERVSLLLVSIEPDALVGTTTSLGAPVRVPTSQIESIERKEIDWVKTAPLIVGIFALLHLAVKSTPISSPPL